jgi:ketosteroid isomerase-like protein
MNRQDAIAGHPNLQVAQGLWTAAAEGDADGLRGFLAHDVVWTSAGRNPLAGSKHGPDEVLDYLASVGEVADEFVSSLDTIFVSDEGAVITYEVTARRGERTLKMDFLMRLRIQRGRITRALMVAADEYSNDAFWS